MAFRHPLRYSEEVQRLRRLSSLWNWLPAFRAVAETQHLPQASEELGVSASALSRTIRLLEEDLGQRLFSRVGRNLELNSAGAQLLSALRASMRLVDDAVNAVASQQYAGPLHLSCPSPFTEMLLLPALATLAKTNPGLVPHLSSQPQASASARLLRGQLDVAFVFEPSPDEELSLRKVATLDTAVYCGRSHPLANIDVVSREDLLSYPFVVITESIHGRAIDGWPAEVPRSIGASGGPDVARALCASGRFLAVLPHQVAPGELRALTFSGLDPISLYAVYRKSLGFAARAEVVIDAVCAHLASL